MCIHTYVLTFPIFIIYLYLQLRCCRHFFGLPLSYSSKTSSQSLAIVSTDLGLGNNCTLFAYVDSTICLSSLCACRKNKKQHVGCNYQSMEANSRPTAAVITQSWCGHCYKRSLRVGVLDRSPPAVYMYTVTNYLALFVKQNSLGPIHPDYFHWTDGYWAERNATNQSRVSCLQM